MKTQTTFQTDESEHQCILNFFKKIFVGLNINVRKKAGSCFLLGDSVRIEQNTRPLPTPPNIGNYYFQRLCENITLLTIFHRWSGPEVVHLAGDFWRCKQITS